MSSPRLSIRITPELGRTIRENARVSGKRSSEVVREVLESHFTARRPASSCFELARRAKVIGCVKGAASDLSTNPRHLKGFGRR